LELSWDDVEINKKLRNGSVEQGIFELADWVRCDETLWT
jgi:hypothetical protein